MQFTAQQGSLGMQYEHLSHDAIMLDEEPIGRLLVNRPDDEIHLVDIALLPAMQGRGIGTTLIRNLLDEGDHRGLPVRLKVMKGNPAALLYERLGFVKTGESDMHNHMERRPFGVR
jgi:ribosomal protein S18 acetylase RimI-like enzyme